MHAPGYDVTRLNSLIQLNSSEKNAFAFDLDLKKVEGGKNVKKIHPLAFYHCSELKYMKALALAAIL